MGGAPLLRRLLTQLADLPEELDMAEASEPPLKHLAWKMSRRPPGTEDVTGSSLKDLIEVC